MNNVQDEILADEPLYRILDSEGNILYDNISIEMITAITQIGTALNKALFDSIKTDLTNITNNKLNISAKATQSEAETGTNNTKYMTPLTATKTKLGSRIMISTGVVDDGDTIPQTAGYSNYAYFVSPTMDYYTNKISNNEIFGVGFRIDCSVDQTTRNVTSKAYIEVREVGSTWATQTNSIKANYIEIAWN